MKKGRPVIEFHRHSPDLLLRKVIDIGCSKCGIHTLCDSPMDHICPCGGRQFVWNDHDVLNDVSKLKEVTYATPSVMVSVSIREEEGTKPEVPARPLSSYQLERRRHLRSFPR